MKMFKENLAIIIILAMILVAAYLAFLINNLEVFK